MREVWHTGERQMHRNLKVAQRMRERGAMVVRDEMPDQHRDFFASQRFLVLSAVDAAGYAWPFLRFGPREFATSPLPSELTIASQPLPWEPAGLRLGPGDKISVLGIEFESRRRNRMNGIIQRHMSEQMHIAVDQSYGNCPRYIHTLRNMRPASVRGPVTRATALGVEDIRRIQAATSLFIASRVPDLRRDRRAGLDVNHRGGRAGFVKVLADQSLIIPDYDGNRFFNTFGNILLDPRAGVMFPDFTDGSVLTLSGQAEAVLDTDHEAAAFGAERAIRLVPERVIRAQSALPLRFDLDQPSRDPPPPAEFRSPDVRTL